MKLFGCTSGICRQGEAVIDVINSYNSKVSLCGHFPNLQYFKRIEHNKTTRENVCKETYGRTKKGLQLSAARGQQVSMS